MSALPAIREMTLLQKVAQMIVPEFRFGLTDRSQIARLIDAGVGGICLFGGTSPAIRDHVRSFQARAKIPLLIAADYENGAGSQVADAATLPTNMAVGASRSEELAELKGRVTARQARALGVTWVFAPVADVNSNPLNPIINTRSFGQRPGLVGRMAKAFARGLRSGGALSCAKHFPGHGDVAVDSHLELPRVTAKRSRLDKVELEPFRAVEADSVMTAHLLVEAVDPDRPGSLSSKVTGLLAGELAFPGLIVTDALMMGGITKFCSDAEAVESAARAGAHMLLMPRDPLAAIDLLEAAVRRGRVPESAVDRAVGKIFEAKRKMERAGKAVEMAPSEAEEAADRIAEASITLASGGDALPLRSPVRYAAMQDDGARGDLMVFEKALPVSSSADVGVLAVFSSIRAFSGRTRTRGQSLEAARRRLGSVRHLVVVTFGTPYLDIPWAGTHVCAYGDCRASQAAAARALKGEIPFLGRLPVTLT